MQLEDIRALVADDLRQMDQLIVERLASDKVYVLPGAVVEMRGRFRISITGNDEMVERALPIFERAAKAS